MTTLRCARCKRPLSTATVIHASLIVGPTCARIMGIATPKTRRQAKEPRATAKNADQLDLPLEVAE